MGSAWLSLGPGGAPSVVGLLSSCVSRPFSSLGMALTLFPFDALDRTRCSLA